MSDACPPPPQGPVPSVKLKLQQCNVEVLATSELKAILGGEEAAGRVLHAMGYTDDHDAVPIPALLDFLFPEPRQPSKNPPPMEAEPAVERRAGHKRTTHMQALLEQGELASSAEEAMLQFRSMALDMASDFKQRWLRPKADETFDSALQQLCVKRILEGCLFVGHCKTDLDSVAGAIGAAHLWGGCAARAEDEVNGEIKFALDFAGIELPTFFDAVPGAVTPDDAGQLRNVCLVDHNEEKQMTDALRKDPNRKKRIVGIIDHHAIADNFSSEKPVYMDVRPWGSMSTIVAHSFMTSDQPMPKHIARILLCAILSDTLNLQSVTTTNADRMIVSLLSVLGEVDGIDELASQMFKAKTMWLVSLGAYEMVRGDQKDFEKNGYKFGIAVMEVTDTSPVLDAASDLLLELQMLKIEKGKRPDGTEDRSKELEFAFCFVVDVTKQTSFLLICGPKELALARVAFPGRPTMAPRPGIKVSGLFIEQDETMMDIGPMVSRKAEFLPAFFKAFTDGFEPPEVAMSAKQQEDSKQEIRKAVALTMATSYNNNDVMQRDYDHIRKALVRARVRNAVQVIKALLRMGAFKKMEKHEEKKL
eukprot:TRINITY_DN47482_c0_g1_i1.p1 TRINITY_DN47482_c0_g1~~TRINITY_DN47482_c0_g1_i1.p1  ORF type:complete len:590 (-),score=123.51 TRINITY_DN47482_c0_g1_i1:279-2048(-)